MVIYTDINDMDMEDGGRDWVNMEWIIQGLV